MNSGEKQAKQLQFSKLFQEAWVKEKPLIELYKHVIEGPYVDPVRAAYFAREVLDARTVFEESINLSRSVLGIRDRESRTKEFEVLLLCPPGQLPSPEQIKQIIEHYHKQTKRKPKS